LVVIWWSTSKRAKHSPSVGEAARERHTQAAGLLRYRVQQGNIVQRSTVLVGQNRDALALLPRRRVWDQARMTMRQLKIPLRAFPALTQLSHCHQLVQAHRLACQQRLPCQLSAVGERAGQVMQRRRRRHQRPLRPL
jgi:hypothetical protein